MKNFKKCALLLASLLGLLLPACGGGGENQDTYVSVQQFETGAKGFYILATPSLQLRATEYIGGSKHEVPPQYLSEVMERLGLSGEAESTIVRGSISGGTSNSAVCDIEYYTLGEQYGVLHVDVQDEPDSNLGFIATAMGCFLPDQVIQDSGDVTVDAEIYEGRVIPTMAGVKLEGTLDFSTGMATLGLNWSLTAEKLEELQEAGLIWPVQASLPFFAISL